MLKKWFNDSETILLSRLQVFAGILLAVAITVDWSPYVPEWALPVYFLSMGVLSEYLRRRRATDL